MRTILSLLIGCFFVISCQDNTKEEPIINEVLDQWHEAAFKADYETYFRLLDENAIFIGTDATERWTKSEFEVYAKPHFDKGKAWSFTSLERTIYVDNHGKIAWFDELLDTSFKICRGSGVLNKTESGWKISHYVLSMTVPNELAKEVVNQKDSIESKLIFEMKKATSQK
ncbi:MAG: nuclear transport factor 2 family protein [Flavobacterium sp.]